MKNKFVEFDVEVNDVITPLSCSAMVMEFIKYIVYQKQLIPYPYERLKMYVDRRKNQLDSMKSSDQNERYSRTENSKHFIISDKYFKKTQDAYNSLENIFKLITEELTLASHDRVEEIVVLLGTSFLNPQEVFRICIPSLNFSHLEKHHSSRKSSRNLFKSIINSEKFCDLVSSSNCTSSLHIMLKMKPECSTNSNLFISRNGFKLPSKGNQAIITFKPSDKDPNCSCFKLKIFEDDSNSDCSTLSTGKSSDHSCDDKNKVSSSVREGIDSSSKCTWYQMKDTLRYFSDVNIDGISVADIWMNPKLLSN